MTALKYALGLAFLGFMLTGCQHKAPKQEVQQVVEKPDNTIMDVEMGDLNRDYVSIKKEIAKHELTILDFWASWCGPCRQEAPTLIETVKGYPEDKLGLIGVSLDKDYNAWKKAIEEIGLPGVQLSELRGWDNTLTNAYGIQAIPSTMIVTKKGEIVARDLRGEELKKFLSTHLK